MSKSLNVPRYTNEAGQEGFFAPTNAGQNYQAWVSIDGTPQWVDIGIKKKEESTTIRGFDYGMGVSWRQKSSTYMPQIPYYLTPIFGATSHTPANAIYHTPESYSFLFTIELTVQQENPIMHLELPPNFVYAGGIPGCSMNNVDAALLIGSTSVVPSDISMTEQASFHFEDMGNNDYKITSGASILYTSYGSSPSALEGYKQSLQYGSYYGLTSGVPYPMHFPLILDGTLISYSIT